MDAPHRHIVLNTKLPLVELMEPARFPEPGDDTPEDPTLPPAAPGGPLPAPAPPPPREPPEAPPPRPWVWQLERSLPSTV